MTGTAFVTGLAAYTSLMLTTYHCPKCSAQLEASGVVSCDGVDMPVFQCESCTVRRPVFGPGTREFEMAFTFAVNAAGQPVDPGDDTPI